MPKKKRKPKPFRAVTAVKELSRERIGSVPPTRRLETDKRKRDLTKLKHKPSTTDLLDE
jgi:hypothetical protein